MGKNNQSYFGSLLLLAIVLLAPQALRADDWEQGRKERPVQMQINIIGGGVFGYHLNDILYIGALQTNPYTTDSAQNPDQVTSQTVYNQDGMTREIWNQSRHAAVELRITPWPFGFYFSGGYVRTEEEYFTQTFDKRSRTIGSGTYNTGFEVDVRAPRYVSAAFGMGINHVQTNGFSWGFGFIGGSSLRKDLKVSITGWDEAPSAEDLAEFEDYVNKTASYSGGGILVLSLGYNF
ncbi:MAG: hypothetical protein A2527_07120 [Candidatus Lambdaproteobacteria bacterium RIFOXYD2_FULL_50_16]|uniref:Outer membrane protein beta-barrel domain-containing protein n=1 Tax=Candidatus Lambdaproteobacteria bacterium RIFOXYD2_FULL_50_16 TaxID=1817772 RepID=A0A1F6GBI3_9PROT|nr:MAG: hypothetical protein A2527_07120 [Candidatus Lambdaproteobacteria bacterium RIFOXYD2_FULL_50_16]